jgi:hypothetical protein
LTSARSNVTVPVGSSLTPRSLRFNGGVSTCGSLAHMLASMRTQVTRNIGEARRAPTETSQPPGDGSYRGSAWPCVSGANGMMNSLVTKRPPSAQRANPAVCLCNTAAPTHVQAPQNPAICERPLLRIRTLKHDCSAEGFA